MVVRAVSWAQRNCGCLCVFAFVVVLSCFCCAFLLHLTLCIINRRCDLFSSCFALFYGFFQPITIANFFTDIFWSKIVGVGFLVCDSFALFSAHVCFPLALTNIILKTNVTFRLFYWLFVFYIAKLLMLISCCCIWQFLQALHFCQLDEVCAAAGSLLRLLMLCRYFSRFTTCLLCVFSLFWLLFC